MLCKNTNKSSNSNTDVNLAPLAFKKIYNVFSNWCDHLLNKGRCLPSKRFTTAACHQQVVKVLRSDLIRLQTKVWTWWWGSWKLWNFPPLDFVGVFKKQLKNFLLRLTLYVACRTYFKLLIANVYQFHIFIISLFDDWSSLLALKMHLTHLYSPSSPAAVCSAAPPPAYRRTLAVVSSWWTRSPWWHAHTLASTLLLWHQHIHCQSPLHPLYFYLLL